MATVFERSRPGQHRACCRVRTVQHVDHWWSGEAPQLRASSWANRLRRQPARAGVAGRPYLRDLRMYRERAGSHGLARWKPAWGGSHDPESDGNAERDHVAANHRARLTPRAAHPRVWRVP